MEKGPKEFWIGLGFGLADELFFTGFAETLKGLGIVETDPVLLTLFYRVSPN
jgi:hypothetical protein